MRTCEEESDDDSVRRRLFPGTKILGSYCLSMSQTSFGPILPLETVTVPRRGGWNVNDAVAKGNCPSLLIYVSSVSTSWLCCGYLFLLFMHSYLLQSSQMNRLYSCYTDKKDYTTLLYVVEKVPLRGDSAGWTDVKRTLK